MSIIIAVVIIVALIGLLWGMASGLIETGGSTLFSFIESNPDEVDDALNAFVQNQFNLAGVNQ